MWMILLKFVWCFLHLLLDLWHVVLDIFHWLESYFMSSRLFEKYNVFDLNKLRYIGIVVDSEEAHDTKKVVELLHWLCLVGLKYVCLYDMEGVLKKHKDVLIEILNEKSTTRWKEPGNAINIDKGGKVILEVISFSEGKDGMAKASSFLCSKHMKVISLNGVERDPVFTEVDIDNALKEIGCWGPDPDLLLIYSPVRCHFGFPAWRTRYTEMVHMGSLKSMRRGAIVKAIYEFTKKHQNYGS